MTDKQTIGGILVDIPNLKTVLQSLIDDYTIDKLHESGELISVDLIHFQLWLDKKYPVVNESECIT